MEPISPTLMKTAEFLAHIGSFLFGFAATALALYAAIFRRTEIFRSELQRRQFDELALVRQQLQNIFFDFYYLPFILSSMKTMSWNLDDLKIQSREDWDQYKQYKNNSLSLYYKFQSPDYFLFPKWVNREPIERFLEAMEGFAPFTLESSTKQTEEERKNYMDEVRRLISYLDKELRERI